jgi:hypothetical protein
VASGAGTGFFTGVLDLDTVTQHRITQADSRFDIDLGALRADFVVR